MSQSKDSVSGIRPLRASASARASPSSLVDPLLTPGERFDAKSFQSGEFSLLQMIASVDSRETITKPYEECPPLRACLKPIEQAVGSVPIVFYEGDPNEDKTSKPIGPEHPRFGGIVKLFQRPSPVHTRSQFFSAGVLHRKLDGEDFWFGFDAKGKPIEDRGQDQLELPASILPVRGRVVGMEVDQRGMPRLWRFGLQGGGTVEAPASTVIHFKDYNPDDPLRGLGDAESLVADIDYWWQAMRFNRALAKNSGDPGGFIINEGATSLAPQEASALEKKTNKEFSPDQAGRRRLLPKGLKYQPNNIAPKDMNFVELMKWTRDMIASVLGVPLPVIGVLDHATLANFQDSIRMFWEGGNGILPYLATVEDVLNERFIRRLRIPGVDNVYARFDVRKIKALREDNSKQYELAQKLASAGIGLSLEEALKLLGLDSDTSKMPYAKLRTLPSTAVPIEAVVGEDAKPHAEPEPTQVEPALDENGQPIATPGAAPVAGAVAVQDTALNGTQIASLLEILRFVSEGLLTPEGGVAVILGSFPAIPEARAREMVSGVNEKPPEPEPAPFGGDGEKPPPTDPPADPPKTDAPAEDDPPKDDAKAATITRDASEPVDEAKAAASAERRTYWEARVAGIERGERDLRRAYKGFRRKYERAQLARLRAAVEGKSITKADGPPLDGTPRFSAEDIADLLLSDAEWVAKLKASTQSPIARIFAFALEDMAGDLGSEPVSMGSSAIVQEIERQAIKLAEGHMSTLADQVREVLVDELSKANSTGSVSQALTERLSEVEDSLSKTWSDRVTRGNTIARTETGKASNSARVTQMRADGITKHEWVSSKDSFVRGTPGGEYADSEYSHYALDGKVVPLGTEFAPELRSPGDENAPAGQVINCRCLSRPVIEPNEGGTPAEE